MRRFDLVEETKGLYNEKIVKLLSEIHEYKVKQNSFIEVNKDTLTSLLDMAKIQSTSASNRIEGIVATEKRIKEIVKYSAKPETRSEEEIAGYKDVLSLIHESYDGIDIKANVLLQLHRDLYKYTGKAIGGKYKDGQNEIRERNDDGEERIRFVPLSAVESPIAMNELCKSYNEVIKKNEIDPLLVMPVFILDFLSIHPYNDGNGRMSRLLTLLLLYKAGYNVGKYISIEKVIDNTKEEYYKALEESSKGWHTNENDYSYIVEYYLETILEAYKEFDERVDFVKNKKMTSVERIALVFIMAEDTISKGYLIEECPEYSDTTIERALSILLKDKKIEKIPAGRKTEYRWISNSKENMNPYMKIAKDLSEENLITNVGGPFGACIVKNGKVVGKGSNHVLSNNDPTAHAEVMAIRDACKNLKTYDLSGCVLYTSSYPCPMCLSAIIWANIKKVYYGNTKEDTAKIGFRDDHIYDNINRLKDDVNNAKVLKLECMDRDETIKTFNSFKKKKDKTIY